MRHRTGRGGEIAVSEALLDLSTASECVYVCVSLCMCLLLSVFDKIHVVSSFSGVPLGNSVSVSANHEFNS